MEVRRTQSDIALNELSKEGIAEPHEPTTLSEQIDLRSAPLPESSGSVVLKQYTSTEENSYSDSEQTEEYSDDWDECAANEFAITEKINPPLDTLSDQMSNLLPSSNKRQREKFKKRHSLDDDEVNMFLLIKKQAALWLKDDWETAKQKLFSPEIFLNLNSKITQDVIYKLQRELLKDLCRVSTKSLFDKHSQGFLASSYLTETKALAKHYEAAEKELAEKHEYPLTISLRRGK